jgi:hypothetical protein
MRRGIDGGSRERNKCLLVELCWARSPLKLWLWDELGLGGMGTKCGVFYFGPLHSRDNLKHRIEISQLYSFIHSFIHSFIATKYFIRVAMYINMFSTTSMHSVVSRRHHQPLHAGARQRPASNSFPDIGRSTIIVTLLFKSMPRMFS